MASRKRFKVNHSVRSVDAVTSSEMALFNRTTTMAQPKKMEKPFKLKALVRATRSSKSKCLKDEALGLKKASQESSLLAHRDALGEKTFANACTEPAAQLKVEEQQKYFLCSDNSNTYRYHHWYPSQHDASNMMISNLRGQPCEEFAYAYAHAGRIQPDSDVAMPSISAFTTNAVPEYSTESSMNLSRDFYAERRLEQNKIFTQGLDMPDNLQKLPLVSPGKAWEQYPLLLLENWRTPESLHLENNLVTDDFLRFETLQPIFHSLNSVSGVSTQGLQSLQSIDTVIPTSRSIDFSSFSRLSSELVIKDSTNPEITSESATPPKSQGNETVAQSCGTTGEVQDSVQRTSLDVEEAVQQLSTSTIGSEGQSTSYSKKRKQEIPLISWHTTIRQSAALLTYTRLPEFRWAIATNCLPEKEEDAIEIEDALSQSLEIAWRRLRLTSRLMQHIIPPSPASFLKDSRAEKFDCGVYTIAKVSLGEACKLARGAHELRPTRSKRADISTSLASDRVSGGKILDVAESLYKCPEPRATNGVTERIKQLEIALKRIESNPSVLEILKSVSELDKLKITNRLTKHHCKGSLMDLRANQCQGEQSGRDPKGPINRPFLQRYVKAVRMPKRIPDGVECLRL
ncbi:hypothetical protein O6H91_07G120000 [Diphasiastrum complanatum]|uniref:Uncharacterized protein n=1 Tax=Diphasiastrum complanatum TaxID=34168 RepID=A0ACC2D9K5_DIPCM|nr:hypothetical protein O6H91_07G120000 [Diphasiastrum complanatum]